MPKEWCYLVTSFHIKEKKVESLYIYINSINEKMVEFMWYLTLQYSVKGFLKLGLVSFNPGLVNFKKEQTLGMSMKNSFYEHCWGCLFYIICTEI